MKTQIPVKQGDKIELQITGLGSSGEGVGKYEGFTVFVKGALPEEKVQVIITLVKKSYAVGRLEAIVTASPERVQPLCPVYESCGGCVPKNGLRGEALASGGAARYYSGD